MKEKEREIQTLEAQLRQINSQKYGLMNIEYYYQQNAKLGAEGKISGLEPEKTYE